MKCTAEAHPEWQCLCGLPHEGIDATSMSVGEFNQALTAMVHAVKRLNVSTKALAWALSFDQVPSPYWTDG